MIFSGGSDRRSSCRIWNEMACYHPFLAIPNYDDPGSRYRLVGAYEPDMRLIYPGSVAVPCGKCIGCRLDYSRNWADRMMLEFDHTKKAIFVTLTYNEDNVPHLFDEYDNDIGRTLRKKDFQDFMKRLRSRKRFEDKEIRFYAAGEYGTHTRRPHYHAIIFGLSLEDFPDRKPKKINVHFQQLYISEEFADIWKKGFILLGNVTWKTCAYVARYVMKKAYNELLPFDGCEPEFSLMSRNPGLGKYYFLEHDIDFEKLDVKILEGGQKIKIPKYFISQLEGVDPDLYNRVKEDRQRFANDATLRKLQDTDLTLQQKLSIEESEVMSRSRKLIRSDV